MQCSTIRGGLKLLLMKLKDQSMAEEVLMHVRKSRMIIKLEHEGVYILFLPWT
jgi:hypothetical protein